MDSRQLLEQLTDELRQRGLPPDYIARFVEELEDHVADLIQERRTRMATNSERNSDRAELRLEERMGTALHLANVAEHEYRCRTFCGRHRVLAFLVAPIPLLLCAWVAFFAGAFLFVHSCHRLLGDAYQFEGRTILEWPALLYVIAWGIMYLAAVVPPAVATVLFCWLARRAELSWRWMCVPVLLIALLAGLYHAHMEPPFQPGRGQLMLGFGTAGELTKFLQFLLPLLIGAWFAIHGMNGRERAKAALPNSKACLSQAA